MQWKYQTIFHILRMKKYFICANISEIAHIRAEISLPQVPYLGLEKCILLVFREYLTIAESEDDPSSRLPNTFYFDAFSRYNFRNSWASLAVFVEQHQIIFAWNVKANKPVSLLKETKIKIWIPIEVQLNLSLSQESSSRLIIFVTQLENTHEVLKPIIICCELIPTPARLLKCVFIAFFFIAIKFWRAYTYYFFLLTF